MLREPRTLGPEVMQSEFHRIRRLPPYVFEEVNKLKASARARGEDIIDFGMGNPDMPTPPHIVEKLIETARDPRSNRYSASRGIKGLPVTAQAKIQRVESNGVAITLH